MLAAGLGLLGIGGAAGLAGASSAPSLAASKPIGVIDPPNTDHPKSDPLVPEQKPDPGASKPGADQPSADHPPPDQSHTGQPQQQDPGPTNAGPSNPDPAQPTGTDHQPPAQPGGTDQPPPVHVPVAPTLALASDTGVSAQDHITSSGSVNVSGLEAGATIEISLDGGKTWTPHGGDAQLPEALFGADGAKHLQVRQVDAQGHEGAVADLSFQLDRTAPDAPHWAMPAGKPALGAADVVAVQGIEDGALLAYRIDGREWAPLDSHQLPATVFNSDGAHALALRQTDLAGNVGQAAEIPVAVDLTPPRISPDAIAIGTEYPGNWRNASRSTNADFSLDYRVNGGEWKSPGSLDLSQEGHYRLEVRDTDAAGNQSTLARELTIDNTPPAKLSLELTNDNGSSRTDKISGDLNLKVVGLEPGATWTFSNGISHIANVGSGDSIPMSALGLDPSGGQQLSRVGVEQRDEAGNLGPHTVVDFIYDPSLGTGVFHV
ncbi:hypothetical protein ABE85_24055 [Mitsuaria sp. 7]|nr:hypothetical protein ABE85_24055 [Mitsuaria sp. 7]